MAKGRSVQEPLTGSLGRAVPFGVVAVGLVALAMSLTAGRAERGWADSSAAAAAGSPVCIAASAHAGGTGGTNWRTDLEVHSVGPGTASFTIQCLVRGQANGSPTSKSFTLSAGKSRRFDDVLLAEFGIGSGAAALMVTASSGQILVTSRTYNLLGSGNPLGLPAGSTFGQFVPGQEEFEAIGPGQQGRLIQLSHSRSTSSGYRTNVGLVNATMSSITVHVALHRNDGVHLGTVDVGLRAKEYVQLDKVFERVTGSDIGDGYAVLTADGASARFFAYASVVDNRTGDPVLVPAIVRAGGATAPTPTRTPTSPGATPTATRTPTRTPTQPSGGNVNLTPYQPSGWSGAVVPASETGTTVAGFLSTWYDTYVDWAVVNWGPEDITSRIDFELRIDGQRYTGWYSNGLQSGYYTSVEDYRIPSGTFSEGWHSLSIVADPDNVIGESNESDNEAGASFEWTNIVLSAQPSRSGTGEVGGARVEIRPVPERASVQTAASSRILVPASAHASGAGGTNWRTDLEVHNPGATTVTFTVELLKRGESNGSPASQTFNLAPGRSVRYDDVLASMFGFTGAAALRITSASEVQVTSRTYNLLGSGNSLGLPAGSTFGQFVAGVPESAAIGSGEQGRLIQLSHSRSQTSGYRTNLGLVNAGSGSIHLEVALYRADGAALGTVPVDLPPGGYTQLDKVFERVTGSDVADGYAVVWTTTSGGRFLAYASVVDNRTGDPVFVPALKVNAGGVPPTPTGTQTGATPTPTLPPSGEPTVSSVPQIINSVMSFLGGGDEAAIPGFTNEILDKGMDAFVDEFVEGLPPEVVTRTANGARADFGSGYTTDSGDVYTGVVEMTISRTTETSTRLVASLNVTSQNLTHNGRAEQINSISQGFDITRRADQTVVGTLSPSASGSRPEGPWSVSGGLQIDTQVCERYPIGGTLSAMLDGRTGTAVFSPTCDGSYQYNGSDLGYYGLGFYPRSCNGTFGLQNKIALLGEAGNLTVDPGCANEYGVGRHVAKGTASASGAHLTFTSQYVPGQYEVEGTFTSTQVQSTSMPGMYLYTGRIDATITEFEYDGSVKCTRQWSEDGVKMYPSLTSMCGAF